MKGAWLGVGCGQGGEAAESQGPTQLWVERSHAGGTRYSGESAYFLCMSYGGLNRTLLDRLGLTPERHCCRFHPLCLANRDQPLTNMHQQLDTGRWLCPRKRSCITCWLVRFSGRFLGSLPPSTSEWVMCHRPATVTPPLNWWRTTSLSPGGSGEDWREGPVPVHTQPPFRDHGQTLRALPGPSKNWSPPWRESAGSPSSAVTGCGQFSHMQRECPLMEVG